MALGPGWPLREKMLEEKMPEEKTPGERWPEEQAEGAGEKEAKGQADF